MYGAGSSILHAPDAAIAALRAYARIPGVWSPRFGFADAFNMDPAFTGLLVVPPDDIHLGAFLDDPPLPISREAPWVSPARFAIDQGPLLLTIHDHLTRTENAPGYVQSS